VIADATGRPLIEGEAEARKAAQIIYGTNDLRELKQMLANAESKSNLLRLLIAEIQPPTVTVGER